MPWPKQLVGLNTIDRILQEGTYILGPGLMPTILIRTLSGKLCHTLLTAGRGHVEVPSLLCFLPRSDVDRNGWLFGVQFTASDLGALVCFLCACD